MSAPVMHPLARPIVIAAGGTGGHFFPAEALAAELLARGHRVALMTDARSGGLHSAAFADAERHVLRGAGLAGRGLARQARAAAALAAGTLQARALLARLRPGAVVGFGGYPSVAPILATRLLRGPRPAVVLHEQNAVLGRANRWLLRHADVLALSFPGTTRVPAGTTTAVVGNPVRAEILALAAAEADLHAAAQADALAAALQTLPSAAASGTHAAFRLLVLGGSLGARVFSDVVPAALAALPADQRARLHVTQQCRAEDLERVRAAYAAAGIACALAPFFPGVAALLAQADCVIARAGASTVAELAVAGRPALLVPLPHAIDDHQSANARAIGATVLSQPDFTPAALGELVTGWLAAPERLARAARLIARQARPDAAARLADLVEARLAAAAGIDTRAAPRPTPGATSPTTYRAPDAGLAQPALGAVQSAPQDASTRPQGSVPVPSNIQPHALDATPRTSVDARDEPVAGDSPAQAASASAKAVLDASDAAPRQPVRGASHVHAPLQTPLAAPRRPAPTPAATGPAERAA